MLLSIGLLLSASNCKKANPNYQDDIKQTRFFHESMRKLTDVIVHDIFSPPVASRIYAYPSIAAYEALVHDYPDYQSLQGQLTDLSALPKPESGKTYCYPVASLNAFLLTGKTLIFSEEKIEEFEAQLAEDIKSLNLPADVYERSMAYGADISKAVLAWANEDNYKQTRTFPKYTIPNDPAKWRPTPPDYMDGIEPHWDKIRPFVIDSSKQFLPPPPTPYDSDKQSKFWKEMMEVYEVTKANKEENNTIAKFWDCNPYVSHHKGHVMFATKKITPGGHWIGITEIACNLKEADFMQTVEAYTRVSIALADGFIACWAEKYTSNLVRPETVINQLLDEDWVPLLQTPPFPEYTSGHSVISRAAAVTLTELYGDNFAYLDSVEVKYGLPSRSFDSFYKASEEAAVSRLYGGIHYRPAIDYGVDQGQKVGEFIDKNLITRKRQIGEK